MTGPQSWGGPELDDDFTGYDWQDDDEPGTSWTDGPRHDCGCPLLEGCADAVPPSWWARLGRWLR